MSRFSLVSHNNTCQQRSTTAHGPYQDNHALGGACRFETHWEKQGWPTRAARYAAPALATKVNTVWSEDFTSALLTLWSLRAATVCFAPNVFPSPNTEYGKWQVLSKYLLSEYYTSYLQNISFLRPWFAIIQKGWTRLIYSLSALKVILLWARISKYIT